MRKYFALSLSSDNVAVRYLDQVLQIISIYLVPIILGLFTIVALVFWDSEYPEVVGKPLEIHVGQGSGATETPEQGFALAELHSSVQRAETRLSEQPFWVSLVTQPDQMDSSAVVEFPSRHAVDVACWDAQTMRPVGSADRVHTKGAVAEAKAGFALTIESAMTPHSIVCRMHFVGPAKIEATQWRASQFQLSSQEFLRKSGLLDGGLILLTLFMLITAVINRDRSYVLFAGWLALNLRVAAQSAGWDNQWLGYSVPQAMLFEMRMVTFSLYSILTVTLFKNLFHEQLTKTNYEWALRLVQFASLPLFILSLVLPYHTFIPILWVITVFAGALLGVLIVRILILARNTVAMWYCASMCITLIAWGSEVLAASLGIHWMTGAINFVTAALSSSLLTAIAMAEKMRVEHTERLNAQTELVHTFDVMPIGLFTLDTDDRFLSANPALIEMLGQNVLAEGCNSWGQYFKEDSWALVNNMIRGRIDGELELQGKERSDGQPAKRYLVKAALSHGKIEGYLQDVTEKYKATERLRFLANNDSLTNVLNRRGIQEVLQTAMNELSPGKTVGLAYLDLDRFKLINDLFGHAAGDEVLKQICDRITKLLNGNQYFGRIGGDEFIIVFPEISISVASWVCRSILESIRAQSFTVHEKAFQVRCSIGLIEVVAGTEIKDAVSTADRACREAKKGHHDNLVIYEKNSAGFLEHEAELDLIKRLSIPTVTDDLFLVMQPIMSLSAPHASLNFEVLLRMRDHNGSVIPAVRIITAAESSGQMGMIDRWVLATTLAWLNTNYAKLTNTQFVCMNLSGASLNDEKFILDAFNMLGQNVLNASRLCIEITEGVALHDLNNTRRFIDRVRNFGCKVALDDFGAGYTSFSYLKKLPADLLKIDGSLVVDMNKHPTNISIVETIVNLARNLGMKTIAEWAEDPATVQVLAEIGVDFVQGYIVARPQSPENLLSATSAASFIDDEELNSYLRALALDPYSVKPPYFPDRRKFRKNDDD